MALNSRPAVAVGCTDRAAQLEELSLGGTAAEYLCVANLSLDCRDDFRERKRRLSVHGQIRVDLMVADDLLDVEFAEKLK